MNNDRKTTEAFFDDFLPKVDNLDVDIVICPPFTGLWAAAEKLNNSSVKLGAQNMHWEESGAFTGEISPIMLKEIPCCDYVIIGHSERRKYFSETDEMVNKKVKAALKHQIIPIVCVGESLEQRQKGITLKWVLSQVENALKDLEPEDVAKVVFAYEPIWAIGTGKTASSDDAQEVVSAIRQKISDLYNKETAEKVRILYGGSVKPENIKQFMVKPDIDGALVGGASLKPDSFYKIAAFNLD